MAEYKSESIYWLLNEIGKQKVVLPAIQRSFIWPENKICDLFDSLIRDYPIGTFLFWNIDEDNVDDLPLNSFVREYDEQDESTSRGKPIERRHSEYIGVLDGQQRITSIYMGLQGKRRIRKKGAPKKLSSSYSDRFLCLNILHVPSQDSDGYEIEFKENDDIEKIITDSETSERKLWVMLSVALDPAFDPAEYVEKLEETLFPEGWPPQQRKAARNMLTSLKNAIHTKQNVNYYPATSSNLSEVVDIFVRVNSGGVKLSASDLMLSIASGEQNDDIHVKIREAVDSINSSTMQSDGFEATKETVLTAGLMFVGASSLSLQSKENYTRSMVNKLYEDWDSIVDALCNAARFIEYIGIKGAKMTSRNLILPVAYYLYHKGHDESYISSTKARKDRILIRQWLLRAMVNSIFRDGTGSTLLRIRDVIDASKHDYFPLDDLMASSTKRKLTISDDTIEEMLEYKYNDGQTLPLLLELCKAQSGNEYHVDHIWPKSKLTKKVELRRRLPLATDEQKAAFQSNCHRLVNLQPLEKIPNEEKGDSLFDVWVKLAHPDPEDTYYSLNCIPAGISYDFANFLEFIEEREKLLRTRIRECLPNDFEAILTRYKLQ